MGTNPDPASTLPATDDSPPEIGAMAGIVILANGLSDTLRTAEALIRNNRRVDLAGLDEQVHDLCARALTLPPEHATSLRPRLLGLLARADSLLAAMAALAPPA